MKSMKGMKEGTGKTYRIGTLPSRDAAGPPERDHPIPPRQ
jgi:hypothetical protein